MTTTATGLARCGCGAPVYELDGDSVIIRTKNHGDMIVRALSIRGVCHNCKRPIVYTREVTVDMMA